MKDSELIEIIPVALHELHESGRDHVYIDELGQQVTRHDEDYLRRRSTVKRFLGYIGIDMPELPSGHTRPNPGSMYVALDRLANEGVVESEFAEQLEAGKPRRRMYRLAELTDESET